MQVEGHDFGISDITEWLHKQAIWQIHSPIPKYVPQVSFNKITRPNMYHQADILYMPYDTVDRKLYKYCLNIVDVASRYKASVPLEDRSSARVAKAFKKIYSKADCPLIWPRVLQVDGGSEFKDEVIRLMDEKGVRIRVGTTHKSQAIVERYNRTLAERLFKIQDAKELLTEGVNTAWVEDLPDIVNELNNSNTRLLGMSPTGKTLTNRVPTQLVTFFLISHLIYSIVRNRCTLQSGINQVNTRLITIVQFKFTD